MKKRIIAVVMMVGMLVSAMGSMAFAADDNTAPGVYVDIIETEAGTEIQLLIKGGELTEFEYAVEIEDVEEYDVTCIVSSEFEDFVSDNDGVVTAGFQYDTFYAAFGGVLAEAVTYEGGVIGTVLVEGGLADGTTISVYRNGELYTAIGYSKYMYGDVDCNGKLEAADALLVLKKVVKLVTLEETQEGYADVDCNGSIEATDALYILKKVVKLIDKFPVEMSQ